MRSYLHGVLGGRAADERVVRAIETTELHAVLGEWDATLARRDEYRPRDTSGKFRKGRRP